MTVSAMTPTPAPGRRSLLQDALDLLIGDRMRTPDAAAVDALIAEHVLGWLPTEGARADHGEPVRAWVAPDGTVLRVGETRWSTSETLATALVDQCTPFGCCVTFECWKSVVKKRAWRARFTSQALHAGLAETLPMAMCLAVLAFAAAEPAYFAEIQNGRVPFEDLMSIDDEAAE